MKAPGAPIDAITREAGVSPRTARRVLNGDEGKGLRSDAVQRAEQIRAVAHSLGYRPNAAARAMREGSFGTVRLALSRGNQSTSTLGKNLLAGVHDELEQRGLHLPVTRISDGELADDRYLPGWIGELMVDGLLMHDTHQEPPELVALIARFRIPTIWINNQRPAACVHLDDESGARLATEHLLALGHRAIAYWSFSNADKNHSSVLARRAGYVHAMQAAGLVPMVVEQRLAQHSAEKPEDDFIASARAALSAGPQITAIIGGGHQKAMVASIAALSLGWSLSRDVSVIYLEDVCGLGLTCFTTSQVALSRQAVIELAAKISCPKQLRAPVFSSRSCATPRMRSSLNRILPELAMRLDEGSSHAA